MKVLSQKTISHLYGITSKLVLVFEILPVLGMIYFLFAILILASSVAGPALYDILTWIGFPKIVYGRDFYVDVLKLGYSTTTKSILLIPIIALFFIRNSIAHPIRTYSNFALSIFLSVPFIWFLVVLTITERPGGGVILYSILYVGKILGNLLPDPENKSGVGYLILWSMALTLVLSSFAYFLSSVTCLIGLSNQTVHLSKLKSSAFVPLHIWIKTIRNFLPNLFGKTGMRLIVYAVMMIVLGSALMQSDRLLGVILNDITMKALKSLMTVNSQNKFAVGSFVIFLPIYLAGVFVYISLSLWFRQNNWSRLRFILFTAVLMSGVFYLNSSASLFAWFIPLLALVPILREIGKELRYMFHISYLHAVKTSTMDAQKILLLRPFSLDGLILRKQFRLSDWLLPVTSVAVRLEETIAKAAFRIAPLIALADPKEKRPEIGALRDYVSDENWQAHIQNKIDDSRCIIFIIGASRYTGWETEQIIKDNAIEKTILVIPPERKIALEYLNNNKQLWNELNINEEAISLITKKNIKCIFQQNGVNTYIIGAGNTDIDYTLAIDFALSSVSSL